MAFMTQVLPPSTTPVVYNCEGIIAAPYSRRRERRIQKKRR